MSPSTDPTPPPAQPPSRRHRLIQRLRVITAQLRAATWRTVCASGVPFAKGFGYTAGALTAKALFLILLG